MQRYIFCLIKRLFKPFFVLLQQKIFQRGAAAALSKSVLTPIKSLDYAKRNQYHPSVSPPPAAYPHHQRRRLPLGRHPPSGRLCQASRRRARRGAGECAVGFLVRLLGCRLPSLEAAPQHGRDRGVVVFGYPRRLRQTRPRPALHRAPPRHHPERHQPWRQLVGQQSLQRYDGCRDGGLYEIHTVGGVFELLLQ